MVIEDNDYVTHAYTYTRDTGLARIFEEHVTLDDVKVSLLLCGHRTS